MTFVTLIRDPGGGTLLQLIFTGGNAREKGAILTVKQRGNRKAAYY